MRKGYQLEGQVDQLVKTINAMGFHAHKNHPKRLADGTYLQGEPFDYEIMIPHYFACFDCKECHDSTWRLQKKDIKQAEELKHCKNVGIDAFFLVYFFPIKKLLKIDVDIVVDHLKRGEHSVGYEYGEPWRISEQLSKAKQPYA